MIIRIEDTYSANYLLLLDKLNNGQISEDKFRQFNLTLILWKETIDIKGGY